MMLFCSVDKVFANPDDLPLSGLIQQTINWWYVFLISPRNRLWHFMPVVSLGDNLHEMSTPNFLENNNNISECRLLKFLPNVLIVKLIQTCLERWISFFFNFTGATPLCLSRCLSLSLSRSLSLSLSLSGRLSLSSLSLCHLSLSLCLSGCLSISASLCLSRCLCLSLSPFHSLSLSLSLSDNLPPILPLSGLSSRSEHIQSLVLKSVPYGHGRVMLPNPSIYCK